MPRLTTLMVTTLLLSLLVVSGLVRAGAPAATPRGQVTLPSGHVLVVEVADTPETRERGYMYRDSITDKEGMVFFMEQIDFHPFWMKNCRIALDILWLDEHWRVVHIEKNLPPCREDPCPNYQPMQAALYVLEVQAGLSGKEGIKLGDHIIFTPTLTPTAPRP